MGIPLPSPDGALYARGSDALHGSEKGLGHERSARPAVRDPLDLSARRARLSSYMAASASLIISSRESRSTGVEVAEPMDIDS
jgi:hypothetical protein